MKNPKEVVIIRTLLGQAYADYIAKEINLRGYRCGVMALKDLNNYLKKWRHFPKNILIHTRIAGPDYTYKKLKNFEKKGYKIINNPETIRLTSDKYKSCLHAAKNKIPCAETIKIKKKEAVSKIRQLIQDKKKLIIKPITSKGQGEFCFKIDRNSIRDIRHTVKKIPGEEIIIQEFINYQRLNRVIVVGSKALIKSVFWDEPKKGWKCSVCLNPDIKHYKNPPRDLLKFAENVAKKFDAEITFIDIFTTKKGYILNEINTACSLILHERISKCNISKKIAGYLLNCLN